MAADPAFVLYLGGSTWVSPDGAVLHEAPPGAVVLPLPPGVHLDRQHVATALAELLGPELDDAERAEAFQRVAQAEPFATWAAVTVESLTILAGVSLSVVQPWWLVAAVAIGLLFDAFAGPGGLDAEVEAELARLRDQLTGQARIQEADALIAMRAEVQGRLEAVLAILSDMQTHKPTGAARLALFDAMRDIVTSASAPVTRIRDEDWITLYDGHEHKARVGLSGILRRVRADGSLEAIPPLPGGPTAFDYRLGIPLLTYVATAWPAMIRASVPHQRSLGTHRDTLRAMAAALDGFAERMQAESLARTEHTVQSVYAHAAYPHPLYFGAPLGLQPPTLPAGRFGHTFPVGAFDLVRYTDDFILDVWSHTFAKGGDEGRIGTFDYTWSPPPAVMDPFGVVDWQGAADTANARAAAEYGRLQVASGFMHVLLASAFLRFQSTPPLRSETVRADVSARRRSQSETPTQAVSPVIFPNVQITAPARLRRYRASARVQASSQEPGYQPALRYRIVLRTIDSLFGREGWRQAGYAAVWSAAHEPVVSDPRNLRLRSSFYPQRVLGERVLYEGTSPTEPVSRSFEGLGLLAHTFDWYVPVAASPWERPVAEAYRARTLEAGDPGGSGGRSYHLAGPAAPGPLLRAPAPMATLSYENATRAALTSVYEDLADRVAGSLDEPTLEDAERRHVRLESVTADIQLTWNDGRIEVRLTGRPEERPWQAYVVVEEAVQAGEPGAPAEWLHTATPTEVVNQLVLVPSSFFRDERAALEEGERLWSETLRRFSESRTLGPLDPVAVEAVEAMRRLRESPSTSTMAESLERRFAVLRDQQPEFWEAAVGGPPLRSD